MLFTQIKSFKWAFNRYTIDALWYHTIELIDGFGRSIVLKIPDYWFRYGPKIFLVCSKRQWLQFVCLDSTHGNEDHTGAGQNIPCHFWHLGQNIPQRFATRDKTSYGVFVTPDITSHAVFCHPGHNIPCHFYHPGQNIPHSDCSFRVSLIWDLHLLLHVLAVNALVRLSKWYKLNLTL